MQNLFSFFRFVKLHLIDVLILVSGRQRANFHIVLIISRDGNTGQPIPFRPSPQKAGQGGAGNLDGVGSNSHLAPPKGSFGSRIKREGEGF